MVMIKIFAQNIVGISLKNQDIQIMKIKGKNKMKMPTEIRLEQILNTMDIPESRKQDFNWLIRNLGIRNINHPDLREALELIKNLKNK